MKRHGYKKRLFSVVCALCLAIAFFSACTPTPQPDADEHARRALYRIADAEIATFTIDDETITLPKFTREAVDTLLSQAFVFGRFTDDGVAVTIDLTDNLNAAMRAYIENRTERPDKVLTAILNAVYPVGHAPTAGQVKDNLVAYFVGAGEKTVAAALGERVCGICERFLKDDYKTFFDEHKDKTVNKTALDLIDILMPAGSRPVPQTAISVLLNTMWSKYIVSSTYTLQKLEELSGLPLYSFSDKLLAAETRATAVDLTVVLQLNASGAPTAADITVNLKIANFPIADGVTSIDKSKSLSGAIGL